MASSDIYSALAALTPQYDTDIPVNVRWPTDSDSAIKPVLGESSKPMRILGVPQNTDESNISFEFIALGNPYKHTYLIQDRLWLGPTEFNEGLEKNSPNMLKYIDSYTAQVKANRGLTTQSHILDVRYSYGWNEWGGVQWFTVDAVVTVEEFA